MSAKMSKALKKPRKNDISPVLIVYDNSLTMTFCKLNASDDNIM